MMRRTISVTMSLAALVAGLMTSMASASAQVGYPPGPQPPVVSQTLPPFPAPAPVSAGPAVAFTGANILRWALIALLLVGVGTLLVAANRRRRVRVAA